MQFNDTLHGFCTGRCNRAASLETKLFQHIMEMREEVLYEIFLYLNKTYDALDCGQYINILAAYGMGPWSILFLLRYLDWLTMVTRARGYYGTPFKGVLGVTQGGLLYPTIFNVVLDVVLWHLVAIVASMEEAVVPGAAVTEGSGREVQHLSAYIYTDNGLLASPRETRLQQVFDTLRGYLTVSSSAPIWPIWWAWLSSHAAHLGGTLQKHIYSKWCCIKIIFPSL